MLAAQPQRIDQVDRVVSHISIQVDTLLLLRVLLRVAGKPPPELRVVRAKASEIGADTPVAKEPRKIKVRVQITLNFRCVAKRIVGVARPDISAGVRHFPDGTEVVACIVVIPGIRAGIPQGAFFAFADIRELSVPSLEFVQYLVREAGVVLTNGSGFDYEGFVRISYAAPPAQIEQAMERMKRAVINMPAALRT